MIAPKCRLCEKNHWGPCNVFTPVANAVANIGRPVSRKESLKIAKTILETAEKERAPKKAKRYLDPEKRKAYQRELMKKRRAKAKKKKEADQCQPQI